MNCNFVFDIDGTLIQNNEMLIEQKKVVLSRVSKTDRIVFASSRAFRGIKSVIPSKFHSEYLILCNGAMAFYNREIVDRINIEPFDSVEVINYLKEKRVLFYLEFGDGIYISDERRNEFLNALIEEAKDEYVAEDYKDNLEKICKIGIVDRMDGVFYQQIIERFKSIKVYQHADGTADIVPRAASKWNMYTKLQLNRQKTIAFGNDSNDYEMLENADVSVAVCPESEEISEVAKYVIEDYSPDALEEMICMLKKNKQSDNILV